MVDDEYRAKNYMKELKCEKFEKLYKNAGKSFEDYENIIYWHIHEQDVI